MEHNRVFRFTAPGIMPVTRYAWPHVAPINPPSSRVVLETLHDLLPQVSGYEVTHSWGGPLAIPRDWHASVGLDPSTGVGWAGGYVGDGVGTANLAGRTLADLLLGEDTELTRLPWVQHRSPSWEPEPLRWAGVNAGLRAMALADTEERATGRPSRIARLMAPLTGGH